MTLSARNPFLFAAVFLVLFGLQSLAYNSSRGTMVERWLVDELTVKPSAYLLNSLLPLISSPPTEVVRAVGHQLISASVHVTVLNGCEGTESMFLLIAAVLAFAAPWRYKLAGVVSGILFIFALNQVRIAGLFMALKYNRDWFQWIHAYIGPTLIILLSCLFFLGWIHLIGTRNVDRSSPASP